MILAWVLMPHYLIGGILLFVIQLAVYVWVSISKLFEYDKVEQISDGVAKCESFAEFKSLVSQYDKTFQMDEWRNTPKSNNYDFKLIQHRLSMLKRYSEKDLQPLIWTVRSGLLRNLGGICEPVLYSYSMLGTKTLIHEYIDAMVSAINKVAAATPAQKIDSQQKSDFFGYSRASFGSTALLLQGGSSFGLFHLGVVKALHEHDLLPRVVSGSSVGALIAALVCVNEDKDIPRICSENGINLQAFSRSDNEGAFRRRLGRLLKHGYLMDIKVLEDCVQSNVGDYTFEDAYKKTGRVLNIVVSSKRKDEIPRLLNYITAPNVLIWSAACASAAIVGLYNNVNLLAKDDSGAIVHWGPSTVRWSDATFERDSPEMRLAELFNVNHFVLSQANPFLVPVTAQSLQEDATLKQRFITVCFNEIRFRILQLCYIGLLPRTIYAFLDQKFQGNVTITPKVGFKVKSLLVCTNT